MFVRLKRAGRISKSTRDSLIPAIAGSPTLWQRLRCLTYECLRNYSVVKNLINPTLFFQAAEECSPGVVKAWANN